MNFFQRLGAQPWMAKILSIGVCPQDDEALRVRRAIVKGKGDMEVWQLKGVRAPPPAAPAQAWGLPVEPRNPQSPGSS